MSYSIIDHKHAGILIVDDDRSFIQSVELVLSNAGFSNVYVATTGVDALSILSNKGEEIYVVLLDLIFPKGIDGLNIIKHLTNVHQYHVGILIVTGYSSENSKEQFFNFNSETIMTINYIEKPIDIHKIRKEIIDTIEKIHYKRIGHLNISAQRIYDKLESIENKISIIDSFQDLHYKLEKISKRQYGIFSMIGIELIKVIIIALAVISLIYFGIGDFLKQFLK